MATKTLARCTCSSFEFGQYGPDGSAESYESTTTECQAWTHRTFAMGHDAKLVGYMVRAELDGLEISRTEGGMRITFPGAVAAAATISDKLAEKAQHQLDAAHRREIKKAGRKVSKKAEPVAEVVALPTTREARIKVGRWEYDAVIDIATGQATHARKLGGMRTVERDEYKEI